MTCALVGSASRAKLLCMVFVITAAAQLTAQITFNNFSSTTGLTLNGSAARSGSVLRLTPATVGQAGSAWFNTAQPVQQGFTSKFDFQVNGGGDGFAFVIQNQPTTPLNALGAGAGALGYGQGGNPGGAPGNGIPNSLAIEFDTFANGWDIPQGSESLDGNHVAVQSCGTAANNQFHVNVDSDFNPTDSSEPAFTACTLSFGDGQAFVQLSFLDTPITIADGGVHTVVVDYDPPCFECSSGHLRVNIDNQPLFGSSGIEVNLGNFEGSLLSLPAGTAYAGFAGGTGGATETADIMNWTFTPHTTMTVGPLHTTAGQTTTFNFGAFKFTSTPENTISPQGDNLTVTAVPIPAGSAVTFGLPSPTKNGTCIDYDNTGGTCWEFDVLCTGPDCSGSYDAEFATSYDHAAAIIRPGFLKKHTDPSACPAFMFDTNQIDGFLQNRIDPTTKAKSGGTGSCWLATQNTDGIADSISNFIGFKEPVQNSAINVIKGGQSVPLGFQVTDSQGQPLSNLSLCTTTTCPTPSITIKFGFIAPTCSSVDSDVSDISGDLADTAGNSGLQNQGNGNYQYVWKTPKVKGCYFARVSLNDGVLHDAIFSLK